MVKNMMEINMKRETLWMALDSTVKKKESTVKKL
jgi:hypothetical protein